MPSVIILGTDAVLAAAPATPVQLAHACLAAGYSAVVPASWGDELLAAACNQQIAKRSTSPAIFCACPLVANRLLGVGSDLGQFMISLVAPPVATARYVRALYRGAPVRVTYVGRCPSGGDESIDARFAPAEFLIVLAERGIAIAEQPEVFDSVIPPDRRRCMSLPGGLPSAESLRREGSDRAIVEMSGADLATQLTRELLSRGTALLDLSLRQGCVCSGAAPGVEPAVAREMVARLEPPRSPTPVIDTTVAVKVDLPLPRGSREPADIVAATSLAGPISAPMAGGSLSGLPSPSEVMAPASSAPEPAAEDAASPAPTMTAPPALPVATTPSMGEGDGGSGSLRRRAPAASASRAVSGVTPTSRRGEGPVLPRAYVVRRRPSQGVPQMPDDESPPPREGKREMVRVIEHSVEPTPQARETTSRESAARELGEREDSHEPRGPSAPASRWASVPAAVPATEPETKETAPPAAPAPNSREPRGEREAAAAAANVSAPTPAPVVAVPAAQPASPHTSASAQPASSPGPAAVAPQARDWEPTATARPISLPESATRQATPAPPAPEAPATSNASDEGIFPAPRTPDSAPPLLRGLRVELLIAAAVGVGLIAGIVAGRSMDRAAAPAGATGAGGASTQAQAGSLQNAAGGAAAPGRDGARGGVRPAVVRRTRPRQTPRAIETTPIPAPEPARDTVAAVARPATDTPVTPAAPAREPEVGTTPAPTVDTPSPAERDAIERELRVRRARLDSLARRLDSLRPPPEAPPPAL